MEPSIHLIIHNIISIISAITLFSVGFFTFLNAPRKSANIAFSLTLLAATVFVVSHVIGVNITDPYISRNVLMFNMAIFFIGAFNLHAILALANKEKEKRWLIVSMYTSISVFSILFFFFPDLFLLPSVPKIYFPNYYAPGLLNWTRVAFLYLLMVPFIMYELALLYRHAKSELERNQYRYFIIAIVGGYGVGLIPNFLVYNVQIDPLWGMAFAVIFLIPFTYGAIRYQLFNIQVIAKQAFLYGISVASVGGLITLLNYSSRWIEALYPNFPTFIISLISALLAVTISILVWRNLRENEILKYEFITTITHKLRTPLTYIKWSTETLLKSKLEEEQRTQLKYIQTANSKLVELTNLVINLSKTEKNAYQYHFVRGNLKNVIEEVISSVRDQITQKKLTVMHELESDIFASLEYSRIKFVIQVLIENAILYTPENGKVTVSLHKQGSEITCSVSDTGIGITKNEMPFLFSKFYRGHLARSVDTEGVGIGLFISKEIIARHKGKIWANSDGENKGSIFSFSLPIVP